MLVTATPPLTQAVLNFDQSQQRVIRKMTDGRTDSQENQEVHVELSEGFEEGTEREFLDGDGVPCVRVRSINWPLLYMQVLNYVIV